MFELEWSPKFTDQAARLPDNVLKQFEKALYLLRVNPRHPSLETKKIQGAGREILEARVNAQYRFTWQYGEGKKIILRNVDNHDECLKNP